MPVLCKRMLVLLIFFCWGLFLLWVSCFHHLAHSEYEAYSDESPVDSLEDTQNAESRQEVLDTQNADSRQGMLDQYTEAHHPAPNELDAGSSHEGRTSRVCRCGECMSAARKRARRRE